MRAKRINKSHTFNFRLRPKELQKIRYAVAQLDCMSMAQFIRDAIQEKISRELKDAK